MRGGVGERGGDEDARYCTTADVFKFVVYVITPTKKTNRVQSAIQKTRDPPPRPPGPPHSPVTPIYKFGNHSNSLLAKGTESVKQWT